MSPVNNCSSDFSSACAAVGEIWCQTLFLFVFLGWGQQLLDPTMTRSTTNQNFYGFFLGNGITFICSSSYNHDMIISGVWSNMPCAGKSPKSSVIFPSKPPWPAQLPIAWPSGLCSLLHDLCSSGNGRNLTAEIKITMVPSLVNNGPCSSTFHSCVQSSEGILFGDQERSFPRKLVCSSWNREKNSVPSVNLTSFAEQFMKFDKIHHLVWLCSHLKSVYQYHHFFH